METVQKVAVVRPLAEMAGRTMSQTLIRIIRNFAVAQQRST
jgi:hypothetical protein